MRVLWAFKELDETLRPSLKAHWEGRRPRLERLLSGYGHDHSELGLTIRPGGDPKGRFEGRAVLHLPTGILAVEARGKDPFDALDRVLDKIAARVRQHEARLRRQRMRMRKARRRRDLDAVVPLLERDRELGRADDFMRLLRPLLGFLRSHAARELRIREIEGAFHRDEATVDELLDEVLTSAWQGFGERPRGMPLDLWLTGLLHETLARWAAQEPRPHESLEEEADVATRVEREPTQVGEQEWWTPLLGYAETLYMEDLIATWDETPSLDRREAEERREAVLLLLGELRGGQPRRCSCIWWRTMMRPRSPGCRTVRRKRCGRTSRRRDGP